MMIFPRNGFSYDGPADFEESTYSYLCRSNRVEMQRARDLLQSWFNNYPEVEKSEIFSRIKSCDDVDSVFFEIFLHEVLTRLGCMIEVHPSTESDDEGTPDFLVTTFNGEQFYLEAKLVTDKSSKEASKEKLLNEILDYIRKFPCPDFFVNVHVMKKGCQSIPRNLVKKSIEQLIEGVDPTEFEIQLLNNEQSRDIKTSIFEYEDSKLEFSLLPKNDNSKTLGSLGFVTYPLRTNSPSGRILKSLKKKSHKYKKLNLPYVIALNVRMYGITTKEIADIVFGHRGFFIGNKTLESVVAGKNKSQNQRVSSLWFTTRLSLDNLWDARMLGIDNPWAERPLMTKFKEFGGAIVTKSAGVVCSEPTSLRDILGLPLGWPE